MEKNNTEGVCHIYQQDINKFAFDNQAQARKVLNDSGIVDIWKAHGCVVNLVGSLCMGLLVKHKDIDLHVYSSEITTESSFAIVAKIAEIPEVMDIKCINGLDTDEHCISWHINYCDKGKETWKFDIIHIERGTVYDGYFERMADRIMEVITPEQKDTILRLKYETPDDKDFHGVEYYEAVIADGIRDMRCFEEWVALHRLKPQYYWIP